MKDIMMMTMMAMVMVVVVSVAPFVPIHCPYYAVRGVVMSETHAIKLPPEAGTLS